MRAQERINSVESDRYLSTETRDGGKLLLNVCAPNITTPSIVVKQEDVVNALAKLGVLPQDDGLRERIEALVSDVMWDQNSVSIERIREALNPTPPFEFPTAHAAVIEGLKEDGTWVRYTRIEGTWRDRYGNGRATAYLRGDFKELRVVHPGMEPVL